MKRIVVMTKVFTEVIRLSDSSLASFKEAEYRSKSTERAKKVRERQQRRERIENLQKTA